MQDNDNNTDTAALRAAIAALQAQRAKLGDTVLELATAPLRCARGWPACCGQPACSTGR